MPEIPEPSDQAPAPPRRRGRPKGTPMSEEAKQRISQSKKGQKHTLAARQKMKAASFKRWQRYDERTAASIRGRVQYIAKIGGCSVEEARVRAKFLIAEEVFKQQRARAGAVEARVALDTATPPKPPEALPVERGPLPQLPEPQGDLSIFQKVLWKVLKADSGYAMTPGERRTLAMGRDRGAFDEAELAVVETLLG